MVQTGPRLPDPLIASVIFAPVACNVTLSAVTARAGFNEASAFEWMMAQDNDTIEHILRSRRYDAEKVKRFVAALCGQGEVATTRGGGPLVTTSMSLLPQVPDRNFPFARHFDLLALPIVEGMSFDADEFVEH